MRSLASSCILQGRKLSQIFIARGTGREREIEGGKISIPTQAALRNIVKYP